MLLDYVLASKINAGVPPLGPADGRRDMPKAALELHVAAAGLGLRPHMQGDVGKAGGLPVLVGNGQYRLSWRQEQSQKAGCPKTRLGNQPNTWGKAGERLD